MFMVFTKLCLFIKYIKAVVFLNFMYGQVALMKYFIIELFSIL